MKKFSIEDQDRLLEYQEAVSREQASFNTYISYLREKYEVKEDEVVSFMGLVKKPKEK